MGASHEVICSVLAYLISQHRYGSPVGKDTAVNRAGIRTDQKGEAKEAFDELRDAPFISDQDTRGIELDSSEFGKLADYLFVECSSKWDEDNIRLRLKHYEGWSNHEWIPPR